METRNVIIIKDLSTNEVDVVCTSEKTSAANLQAIVDKVKATVENWTFDDIEQAFPVDITVVYSRWWNENSEVYY